jgi:hypothetical protein
MYGSVLTCLRLGLFVNYCVAETKAYSKCRGFLDVVNSGGLILSRLIMF